MQTKQKLFFYLPALLLLCSCAKALGPEAIHETQELHYSGTSTSQDKGILYVPENHNSHLLVVVHGGGWTGRDLDDMTNISKSLVTHGYLVFNINYRLAPQHHHPAAVADLGKALVYILDVLKTRKIDVQKIGLWGYSSGAHTVAYYALKYAKENSLPRVDVVVAGGGPMDLTWQPHSPYMHAYIGFYRDENLDAYMEASPANYVTSEAPPFFLYHALEDRLVEHAQSTAFQAKLMKAGVKNRLYDIAYWGHTTAFVFSSQAIEEAITFLNVYFGLQSPN
jgi:acetyl esterase/lipase